jgi:hypothetical protein
MPHSELVHFNGTSVEIDVSDPTFIDVAALGALVGAGRRCLHRAATCA